jgi:hypothetical protein
MSAKYSCDGCGAEIEGDDAKHAISRIHNNARVVVYISPVKGDGDMHLCTKCAANILVNGVRPVEDEIPF